VDPPLVAKYDNESTPVLSIALSGAKSVRELTEVADKIIKATDRALYRRW
jgi:HAE1 family hydrophobic/amphiphilic exporter-1